MALPVPLAVRLLTSRADRLLVDDLRDIQYRSTMPGGFASATITLDRPLIIDPAEIDLYAHLWVYDRSGGTQWEGRLWEPDRSVSADGQIWKLAAVGPSAHAEDRNEPYVPVDTSIDDFEMFGGSRPTGSVSQATTPDSTEDGVKCQIGSGDATPTNGYVAARSLRVQNAGMKLARVSASVVGGGNAALWRCRGYAYGPNDDPDQLFDLPLSTTASHGNAAVIGEDFADGQYAPYFRIERAGDATPADGNAWALFFRIVIRTALLHEYGAPVTDYSNDFVYAHEIVADILGRWLPKFSGAKAFIEETSFQIDQLSWPNGVTPAQVLARLMELEPGYTWGAWESEPTTGLHRFEWIKWPNTVELEADIDDGFDGPGSAADLRNRVTVVWRDRKKRYRSTSVDNPVPALTAAGLIRQDRLDLGEDSGSSRNAQRAADAFLDEHSVPPNAGTLVVGRAILNIRTGRMLNPWELRPGVLIRVRGIRPYPDSLNAVSRDGWTVFRVVSTDYSSATGLARLELDSFSRSTARAIADLRNQFRRRH